MRGVFATGVGVDLKDIAAQTPDDHSPHSRGGGAQEQASVAGPRHCPHTRGGGSHDVHLVSVSDAVSEHVTLPMNVQ